MINPTSVNFNMGAVTGGFTRNRGLCVCVCVCGKGKRSAWWYIYVCVSTYALRSLSKYLPEEEESWVSLSKNAGPSFSLCNFLIYIFFC